MTRIRPQARTVWLTDLDAIPDRLATAVTSALEFVEEHLAIETSFTATLRDLGVVVCEEHELSLGFSRVIESEVVRRMTAAGGAFPPPLISRDTDYEAIQEIEALPTVLQKALAATAITQLRANTNPLPSTRARIAGPDRSPEAAPTGPQSVAGNPALVPGALSRRGR
ncbi:hypothetical protein [Streptomyces sp. SID3343]|uniref:hypothetical protein n=1 Tax=Streptomyces sp. SID3343 TaxID=2690260 RepID=UPI0013699699|nr:hypothetical protein [Streptomyces sp. SID3343]MYW03355.1 hypothetical protein [Streptomyces sp. SID3343]MYW06239.1 hypothetical protein [Streptomyces sp. SID3343]